MPTPTFGHLNSPRGAVQAQNWDWDPALLDWVPSTGAPVVGVTGPVSIADGADVAEGATTNAAVVTDTTGTVSGKLRGLVKWAFERMPTSLGQKTMAASFPVVVASDQSTIPISAASLPLPTGASTSVLQRLPVTTTAISIAPAGPPIVVTLDGDTTAVLTITDASDGIITGEISPDGITWRPIPQLVLDTLTSLDPGLYQNNISGSTPGLTVGFNVAGALKFRVASITNTGTVLGTLSTGRGYIPPKNQVAQGISGTLGVVESWWMKLSDATTGPVAVKPASTVAVAADKALVVAVSPNNTPVLPSGAATAANQATEIASLSILDDWDEIDRAKVNPIVGQAGIQGGSGIATTTTQRVVLATDIPLPAGTNTIGIVSTKTDLAPAAPTFATVGVASAQVVAANASRKGLKFTNTSGARISLGFGATAVLDSGDTLYPGGHFHMDEFDFDLGAVNAIASAAASNLGIQEYS